MHFATISKIFPTFSVNFKIFAINFETLRSSGLTIVSSENHNVLKISDDSIKKNSKIINSIKFDR